MTMNDYRNPLDQFRSYSIHYVLSATDTTEAIRRFLSTEGGGKYLSEAARKKLGESIDAGNNKGKAWLLVDTRRFSQFSITHVEMEHMLSGGTSNLNMPSGLLSMTLIDTTGLTFYPFLMDVMQNKLEVSKLCMFFLLSVIFVGHRDDGATETVSTCHIPMSLTELEFDFKSTGSEYKMLFAELSSLSPRDRFSMNRNFMGRVTSVSTRGRGGDTLGALFDDLEDRLNRQSLEYFLKYKNAANDQISSTTGQQIGKLVQYMITVPETKEFPWRQFKLTKAARSKSTEPTPAQAASIKKAEEQQAKAAKDAAQARIDRKKRQDAEDEAEIKRLVDKEGNTKQEATAAVKERRVKIEEQWIKDDAANKQAEVTVITDAAGSYSQITFGPNGYIDHAINDILQSSYEFLDLMSDNRVKAGTAISHTINTYYTSDENSYIVHFDIVPRIIPPEKSNDQKKKDSNTLKAGSAKTQQISNERVDDLIVYDYTFTGKNSHIKDLKVHFGPAALLGLSQNSEIGTSRFAENANAGQKKQDVKDASKGATKSVEYLPLLRTHDPVMIPIIPKDQQTNNAADRANETRTVNESGEVLSATNQYAKNTANVHCLSSMQLDVTIRGNPNLVRKYADVTEKGGIPTHMPIISAGELNSLVSLTDRRGIETGTSVKNSLKGSKDAYIKEYVKPKIDSAIAQLKPGQDPLLNKKDPMMSPPLVQINIKSPNVDTAGNFITGVEKYVDSYFNSKPYRLVGVKTSISGVDFTQRLTLIMSPESTPPSPPARKV